MNLGQVASKALVVLRGHPDRTPGWHDARRDSVAELEEALAGCKVDRIRAAHAKMPLAAIMQGNKATIAGDISAIMGEEADYDEVVDAITFPHNEIRVVEARVAVHNESDAVETKQAIYDTLLAGYGGDAAFGVIRARIVHATDEDIAILEERNGDPQNCMRHPKQRLPCPHC